MVKYLYAFIVLIFIIVKIFILDNKIYLVKSDTAHENCHENLMLVTFLINQTRLRQ